VVVDRSVKTRKGVGGGGYTRTRMIRVPTAAVVLYP